MKTQHRTTKRSKIRNVYLADLHKILSIHGNKTLTTDFGLPLALAEYDKEICGYAFASFNSYSKPEIQTLFKQGFETEEVKHILNEQADKVFGSMYATDEQGFTRLERHIKRLTDWLNLCNEPTVKETTFYKSSIDNVKPLPTKGLAIGWQTE
ncbi:MAG TPA: hypothetical protein PKW69_12080 [Niabella sp.]|nr:hypothetical protein [Niabella sp.]